MHVLAERIYKRKERIGGQVQCGRRLPVPCGPDAPDYECAVGERLPDIEMKTRDPGRIQYARGGHAVLREWVAAHPEKLDPVRAAGLADKRNSYLAAFARLKEDRTVIAVEPPVGVLVFDAKMDFHRFRANVGEVSLHAFKSRQVPCPIRRFDPDTGPLLGVAGNYVQPLAGSSFKRDRGVNGVDGGEIEIAAKA